MNINGLTELPYVVEEPKLKHYLDRAPLQQDPGAKLNPSLSLQEIKEGRRDRIDEMSDTINRYSILFLRGARAQERRVYDAEILEMMEDFEQFIMQRRPRDPREGIWELSFKAISNLEENSHLVFPFDNNLFNPTLPDAPDYYLHASRVSFPGLATSYVATQAPTENTINNFWHAIIAGKCNKIVTLVMGRKEGDDSCFNYWRVNKEHTLMINGQAVGIIRCIGQERLDSTRRNTYFNEEHVMHREFRWIPVDGSEGSLIHQYQYGNWIDNQVPNDPALFNRFLDDVHTLPTVGPIVVHCRGGIGRTGVFIAADSYWQSIKPLLNRGVPAKDIRLNLVNRVLCMREQRIGLVGNINQLSFILFSLRFRLDD